MHAESRDGLDPVLTCSTNAHRVREDSMASVSYSIERIVARIMVMGNGYTYAFVRMGCIYATCVMDSVYDSANHHGRISMLS